MEALRKQDRHDILSAYNLHCSFYFIYRHNTRLKHHTGITRVQINMKIVTSGDNGEYVDGMVEVEEKYITKLVFNN